MFDQNCEKINSAIQKDQERESVCDREREREREMDSNRGGTTDGYVHKVHKHIQYTYNLKFCVHHTLHTLYLSLSHTHTLIHT